MNNSQRNQSKGKTTQPQDTVLSTVEGLPPIIVPHDYHLLITTENRIYRWEARKSSVIFSSSDGGIVAAKEAENGTGLLAVGDGHVVVVCKGGEATRKWKLKADTGRVALVSFANTYKDVIFSTSLQHSLLRYSIAEDRMLEVLCAHPSSPNVIAVSLNSTYLVSASSSPPVAYLQDLAIPGSKIHLRPRASTSLVTVASFHPERDEIFLLGYADGTVSVHTASRIVLMRSVGSDGGMGHQKRTQNSTNVRTKRQERKIHRRQYPSVESASASEKNIGVTAASFISGYRLRVMCVFADGKCRIVDFENGPLIIRTWHTRSACTSLAVFSPKVEVGRQINARYHSSSPQGERERDSTQIIAVGRGDGSILLYDALGLLRNYIIVDDSRNRIIDLAWVSNRVGYVPHANSTALLDSHAVNGTFKSTGSNNAIPPCISIMDDADGSMKAALSGSRCFDPATSPSSRSARKLNLSADDRDASVTESTHINSTSKGESPSRLLDFLRRGRTASSPQSPLKDHPADLEEPRRAIKDTWEKPVTKSRAESNDPSLSNPRQRRAGDAQGRIASAKMRANSSTKLTRHMPCAWMETPSSYGSPALRELMESSSPKYGDEVLDSHVKINNFKEKGASRDFGKGNRQQDRQNSLSAHSFKEVVEEHKSDQRASLSPGWESDVEDSSSSRSRMKGKNFSGHSISGGRQSPFPTNHSHTTNPLFVPGIAENERGRREVPHTLGELPLSMDSRLPPEKPLPGTPKSENMEMCECACTAVVRQEMVLVRAEISCLRKGIWVFGDKVERAALSSPSLAQRSGQEWLMQPEAGPRDGKLRPPIQ